MATPFIEFPPKEYARSLFIGNPPPFTCGICLEVLKKAVQCLRGHSQCAACVDTWKRQSNTCPVCHEELTVLVRNRAVDDFVEKATVMCFTRLGTDGNTGDSDDDEQPISMMVKAKLSNIGSDDLVTDPFRELKADGDNGDGRAKRAKLDVCDWVGQLQHAEEHFKTCPYAGVRCSHEGCGALVARRDLPGHQGTCVHGKRVCKWPGCGAAFCSALLAIHDRAPTQEVCACRGCRGR